MARKETNSESLSDSEGRAGSAQQTLTDIVDGQSDGPEGSQDADGDDTTGAPTAPWERSQAGARDPEQALEDLEVWGVSDDYPRDDNYICDLCDDFSTDDISDLKAHVTSEHDLNWGRYVFERGLHRCAGCESSLVGVGEIYCPECSFDTEDRVSCRNCGEIRVPISDPFCSPECAAERVPIGDPLSPPENPTGSWLNHPHRLPNGVPSSIPFIANHTFTCRECYTYGSDSILNVGIHVGQVHDDLGWGGYIEKYELNTCRVCGEAVPNLRHIYCSKECQLADDDPPYTCTLDGCENGIEPDHGGFCSKGCMFQYNAQNLPAIDMVSVSDS